MSRNLRASHSGGPTPASNQYDELLPNENEKPSQISPCPPSSLLLPLAGAAGEGGVPPRRKKTHTVGYMGYYALSCTCFTVRPEAEKVYFSHPDIPRRKARPSRESVSRVMPTVFDKRIHDIKAKSPSSSDAVRPKRTTQTRDALPSRTYTTDDSTVQTIIAVEVFQNRRTPRRTSVQ